MQYRKRDTQRKNRIDHSENAIFSTQKILSGTQKNSIQCKNVLTSAEVECMKRVIRVKNVVTSTDNESCSECVKLCMPLKGGWGSEGTPLKI